MVPGLDQTNEDGRRLGHEAMRRLQLRSVCPVDAGLTDSELDRIEQEFGFRFAADRRAFLAAGLPVNTIPEPREPGLSTPTLRHGRTGVTVIQAYFARCWICPGERPFDVKHAGFWHDSWGAPSR